MADGQGTRAGRTLIIAELGMTHDGSLGQAKAMIDAAAECGADAVKFQTHIFEAESTPDAPAPPYFRSESRAAFFRRTAFDRDQHAALRDHAEACGVMFLSSPFSEAAVDLLEDVGVAMHKVPSGEVTNLPLLRRIARTGRPVLLSSGMSTLAELDEAVEALRGCDVTVMQCTSRYPCPPEDAGLNLLALFRERWGLPVGFSDHTLGTAAPVVAVALGASVVEKHFTLSRRMYGPDARFSLDPDDFARMVAGIREAEALRDVAVDKDAEAAGLAEMRRIFQKSLATAVAVSAGTILTRDAVAPKKPGTGIPPRDLDRVVGRRVRRDLPVDHVLAWDDLE